MTGTRVIGVDLGGTKILAGVIDPDGRIERQIELPTPAESQEALIDGLVRVVRELATPQVEAVGFGIPARIDPVTGIALGAVNIPLHHLRFRDVLERRLGLPVGAVNDAGGAALAEAVHGVGRGARNLVLLTLGTGVGGGLVLDGKLYAGWAEFGHMVIVEDGEPCQGSCTGHGHVESYCSGLAADRLARRVLGAEHSARDLVEQHHPALAEIGRHLGMAIASLLNLFHPEIVVIGGGVGAAAGEQLLEAARPVIRREALAPAADDVSLAVAELGSAAGMIGAGLIAFETLV